jgi:hypothetical protein
LRKKSRYTGTRDLPIVCPKLNAGAAKRFGHQGLRSVGGVALGRPPRPRPPVPTGTAAWTHHQGNEAGNGQAARPGHRKNLIFGDNLCSSLPRQHSERSRDSDQLTKPVAQIVASEIVARS